MRDLDALQPIRCAGCRSTLGWSVNAHTLRHKAFCTRACASFAPASADYVRNVEWAALHDAGVSPVKIGQMYGAPHSLVYKTLARMREAS